MPGLVEVVLLPIDRVRPSEQTDVDHVRELVELIANGGIWTHPISVERQTCVIMDGHHRLAAGKLLRLATVPCVRYGYDEVSVCASRPEFDVFPREIIARGLSGSLYPKKTTKHTFPHSATVRIPLGDLRARW